MINLASLSRSVRCLRAPGILALLSAPILTLSLTGCGISPLGNAQPDVISGIAGTVYGGQQPIGGSTVRLIAMGNSGYGSTGTVLSQTTANAAGFFTLPSHTCANSGSGIQANTPVYILGTGGNPGYGGTNLSITFAAFIGTCSTVSNVYVNMNEVNTIATAYAFSGYFTTTLGSGSTDAFGTPTTGTYPNIVYPPGVINALATVTRLVTLADGTPNLSNPYVTVENLKLNTLANILAACVNSTGSTGTGDNTTICGREFTLAQPSNYGTTAFDTLQLAISMAVAPYNNNSNNVITLYNDASTSAFQPSLTSAPHDLTLAVAYTNPNVGLSILPETTSNLAIDANGKVWFPVTNPTAALVSLDPTILVGSPFSTPITALGGITHPQNIAIDHEDYIWVADLGSGGVITGVLGTSPSTTVTPQGFNSTDRHTAINVAPDDSIYDLYFDVTDAGTNGYTYIIPASNRGFITNGAGYQVVGHFPNALVTDGITNASGVLTAYNQYSAVTTGSYGSGNTGYIFISYCTSCNTSPNTNAGNEFGAFTGNSGQAALSIDAGSGNPGTGTGTTYATTPDAIITNPANNQICSRHYGCQTPGGTVLNGPQGIAVDGGNSVWIANSGSASVSQTVGANLFYRSGTGALIGNALHSSSAAMYQTYSGPTMTIPYGVAIDASGNVWVSNAGCVTAYGAGSACTPGPLKITELIGVAAPTIMPLSAQTYHTTNGTGGLNALIGTEPTH